MEKTGTLIKRLQEQYSGQADEATLLNTALMLVAELQNNNAVAPTTGKVSVILPHKPFEVNTAAEKFFTTENEVVASATEEPHQLAEEPETVAAVAEETEKPAAVAEEAVATQPEPATEPEVSEPPVETIAAPALAINTLAEEKYQEVLEAVPTLAQQQPKIYFDLNDTMQTEEPSINDRLKPSANEAAGKLHGEPIKDLKKAIGINDKYLFIKELFRNDETAYERSIKTINSFNILPEAEYWIQREMKYKLGWDDNNPTVKAFYQLVRRRFS